MNKKLLYILLALVMVCSVALTACNLTPAKVTITYKYNYEGAPADKTVTLDEGATITLDTPTRTDYKFDGWFTDAACTKAFTDKVANANVTLYAKWTASHTHDLHYQSSSSKHWQECSCGYTTEQVDHTFDANNTCVCGYKQGGTAHTHSWATDWSKDATNHWHVCTGCSELNDKAAHDTSGTDGACSVCGYNAQAQGQAVTVYFYTADWTTVNAYAWTDTPSFAEHLGAWPGTAINAVAGEEGWYSVEVPADTQKIIFNDGSKQTKDLLITDGPYFVGSNGYATKAEAEEALSKPAVTTYTLRGGFNNWGAGLAFEAHEEGQVKLLGVELEAGVQFKVYITNGQTEEWISALEEGVTVAINVTDESGNENITVSETGIYDLYFKIEAKQLYIAKVVEEHEHVASETYSSDATGHWYACTTCSAVIEGSFAEHDTEGEEGACSVCGYTKPVEPEKVTVYYYTTTWTAVYAYAWTANEDKPLGEWPGTAINAVSGEEGWYSVEVPVDAQNIIFNNNDGAQTDDLLVADGPYFVGNTGYATKEEAEASLSAPETWTVAGTAGLCGTEWETTNADNDMTYDSEKEAWVKTYTGIAAGEHKFKVVKNHMWDEAYPAEDYVLNVASDDATVTIVLKGQEVTVEVIEKEHEHVAAETLSKDATGHWYACTTCSAVIEGSFAEHDTEGEEGACSVCGWVTPVEPEKVTLYYYTTTWTAVYAYAWTANEDKTLGEWPGTAINAVSGEEGWYSVEVSVDAQNIIFNNNDGAQTADLLVADGPYFYANSGYATKEEAEAAISAPVVTTYTLKGSFDTWGVGVAFEAHTDTEVKLLNVALEANAEFKVVISVTGQSDEWINTLKKDVTVATHAANGNITVAESGKYNLYFDFTAKQLWIEKVVEEHEHVASETYSSDATGHWYACTTCSAVIEGTQGDHDTNGTDGACSVCGWVTPVEEEKVTVFFYNHQGWTTVHAYAWTNVEDSETVLHLGAWPGTEISAVDGEEGWYSVEVSADAQKIIFNDGSAQTADLEIKEGLVYFYNVAGYASKELAIAQYEADVKADEEAKKESRIYLDVTALTWFGSSNAVIKAYVWYTDDTNNTWPGVEMEIIDEMYSIKYDDTKTIQGIIFLRLSPDGTEWNRIELQEVSFNIETPVYVVSSNGGAIGSGTWSTLAE